MPEYLHSAPGPVIRIALSSREAPTWKHPEYSPLYLNCTQEDGSGAVHTNRPTNSLTRCKDWSMVTMAHVGLLTMTMPCPMFPATMTYNRICDIVSYVLTLRRRANCFALNKLWRQHFHWRSNIINLINLPMTIRWLSNDYPMTIWWPSDDYPMTNNDYQWLPMTSDDYWWLLMTTDDYPMTIWWLSDGYPMSIWWLSDDSWWTLI